MVFKTLVEKNIAPAGSKPAGAIFSHAGHGKQHEDLLAPPLTKLLPYLQADEAPAPNFE
jgi:hypothetical protein